MGERILSVSGDLPVGLQTRSREAEKQKRQKRQKRGFVCFVWKRGLKNADDAASAEVGIIRPF